MITAMRIFFLRVTGADRLSAKQRKNIGEFFLLAICILGLEFICISRDLMVRKLNQPFLSFLTMNAGQRISPFSEGCRRIMRENAIFAVFFI